VGSASRGQTNRKSKVLNLLTVKFHFLGDYVRHIRLFGTTDSYSTQLVSILPIVWILYSLTMLQGELAHRLIKRLYGLTNKKDPMKQIGKKYNRHEALRPSTNPSELQEAKEAESECLADHHVISGSRNSPISLFNFVQTNRKDSATKVWHAFLDL
jgi:hypothetical protein